MRLDNEISSVAKKTCIVTKNTQNHDPNISFLIVRLTQLRSLIVVIVFRFVDQHDYLTRTKKT